MQKIPQKSYTGFEGTCLETSSLSTSSQNIGCCYDNYQDEMIPLSCDAYTLQQWLTQHYALNVAILVFYIGDKLQLSNCA